MTVRDVQGEWVQVIGQENAAALQDAWQQNHNSHFGIVVHAVAEDKVAFAEGAGLTVSPAINQRLSADGLNAAQRLVAVVVAEPVAPLFPGEFA